MLKGGRIAAQVHCTERSGLDGRQGTPGSLSHPEPEIFTQRERERKKVGR